MSAILEIVDEPLGSGWVTVVERFGDRFGASHSFRADEVIAVTVTNSNPYYCNVPSWQVVVVVKGQQTPVQVTDTASDSTLRAEETETHRRIALAYADEIKMALTAAAPAPVGTRTGERQ